MNRKQLLKRSSIALLATTALLVTAFLFACITTTQLKQAYADNSEINGAVQIIEDDHATAYVKKNRGGYIILKDPFGYYNKNHKLTEIAGIPLENIVHSTYNNATVSEFWTEKLSWSFWDYSANVTARGPDWWGHQYEPGYMQLIFTDDEGGIQNLQIWSSWSYSHRVRYISNKPRIAKIEWSY